MNKLSRRLYYSPDTLNASPYLCEEVTYERLQPQIINEIVEQLLQQDDLQSKLDILAFEAKYIGSVFAWMRFQLILHCLAQQNVEVCYQVNPYFNKQCKLEQYLLTNLVLPYGEYLRKISSCFEVYSTLMSGSCDPLYLAPGTNIIRQALKLTDFIENIQNAASEICPILLDIQKCLSNDIVTIYNAVNGVSSTECCVSMKAMIRETQGAITSRIFKSSILGDHLETTMISKRSPHNKWREETTMRIA